MALAHQRPFHGLRRWEPFGEVDTLRKEMDSLFENFLSGLGRDTDELTSIPSAEIDETDTEFHLKLEFPGMRADVLEIEVTDEAVAITGERKFEIKSEEGDMLCSEFYYGKFEHYVPLPSQIQRDNVMAEYKDNILSLTLPKSEDQRQKSFKVKVT